MLLCGALLVMPVLGQQATAPWYEVEMLIFAENQAATREQWLPLNDLHYPDEVVRFVFPSTSTADASDEAYWLREPDSFERVPFAVLPRGERKGDSFFVDVLERLASGNRFRVLFHERWEQPVESRGRAPHLLIEGGEIFGEYSELQGSVQLSISRYLHFKTNLWLTDYRFGGKSGQPLPPLPPPEKDIEDTTVADPFLVKARNISHNIDNELRQDRNIPTAVRTVRIDESRRMRSGELHYLDHPMFGILLRILAPEEDD